MKKTLKKVLAAITAVVMLALCSVSVGADTNGIIYYGDMNMDGYITATDAVMLKQAVLGLSNPTGDDKRVGDIDKSSAVNSTDVLLMNQHMLGVKAIIALFQEAMWTAVPFTSAAQAAAGIEGGEGCQWPLFITFSETDGNIAFMGIDVGGLYRSTDGGKSWAQSTIGIGSEGTTGIAVDPNNGNRVLLCGVNSSTNWHNGLYLSTDAGITWDDVCLNSSVQGHRDYRDSIAFDKSSYSSSIGGSSIAYWLTDWGQLYKSTNGGVSWSSIANSSNYANSEIFVNPSNGYVYIASSTGFYRSTNKGSSFEKKLSNAITGIDVIGTYPNNVYLSTSNGLYISTDSGNSFSNSKGTNYPACAYRLEVSPADPNYMIVSNDQLLVNGWYSNSIFYSQNGGKTWASSSRDSSLSIIPYNVRSEVMAFHPTDKNIALSTGGDMAMRSTDGGKSWKWSNSGYNGSFTTDLTLNVNHPEYMYASNQDYSGFFSLDAGKTWKYISWYEAWGGFTYGGYVVDKDHIIAVNNVNGSYYIYYTTDGGATVHNTGVAISNSYSNANGMPGDDNIVFCSAYRSTNKGVSWSKMSGCEAVLDFNPNNGNLYGVNSSNQAVVSTNKGVSWSVIGSVNSSARIIDMEYDIMGNRLIILTENYAVLFGLNCATGRSTTIKDLTSMRDGFGEGLILRGVEVDPENSNRIYVSNARHIFASDVGVLMTENGGSSWTNLTSTVNNIYPGADGGKEVGRLVINPETRVMYVTTMCRGVYKTKLPNN